MERRGLHHLKHGAYKFLVIHHLGSLFLPQIPEAPCDFLIIGRGSHMVLSYEFNNLRFTD